MNGARNRVLPRSSNTAGGPSRRSASVTATSGGACLAGCYKTGAYGIRIENLVAVTAADGHAAAEREMLAFETLTLAPIDLDLVEPELLSAAEIAWLDAYHARVRASLAPLLDRATARWLEAATRALGT